MRDEIASGEICEPDLTRFASTATLYIDDQSFTNTTFIAWRISHELSKYDIEVAAEDIKTVVDLIASHHSEIRSVDLDGLSLYRWELLWICYTDIVQAVGGLVEGVEVDEFWFFGDLESVKELFSKSAIHTIKSMESEMSAASGCDNPLKVLTTSFLNGEGGDQAMRRMVASGTPLKVV